MDKKETIKAYAAWGAVCFFWGTTYLAIRVGVEVIPPALFAGIRFATAGIIFLIYLKLRGYSFPSRGELVHIAIVGISLLAIANGLVVWSEQWVPSGLAALIVATVPFWMAGIESALPSGEKLNVRKVVGILVGFMGLVLLLGPDLKTSFDPAYLKGILALLLAPLSWAAGSIYSKYRTIKTNSLMAAALQMIIAGTVLILLGTVLGEFNRISFSFRGLAALIYLVIFGSIIGYVSYIYALTKLPSSTVSMYAYVNPVIAVMLGWLVLDERLDWIVATATAIILVGVVLVKTSRPANRAIKPAVITNEELSVKEQPTWLKQNS